MPDHIRLSNGLTPKQEKLKTVTLEQIAKTGKVNLTQVGLEVFNTTNRESARVMATQELQNPTIREIVEQALTKNGLTPDTITNAIKDIAVSKVEKVSADTKLNANIQLLKLWGAYPGTKHSNLNINIKGDINKMNFTEAKEALKKLRTDNNSLLQDIESDTIDTDSDK